MRVDLSLGTALHATSALIFSCRVMASVAEDNIVQVWQMCENIYLQEDDLPDVCSPMMALLAPLIVTFSYCTLIMPPASLARCRLPPTSLRAPQSRACLGAI